MSGESSVLVSGVGEDAVASNNSDELNQVEGVYEIESLCMNCHDNVCTPPSVAIPYS